MTGRKGQQQGGAGEEKGEVCPDNGCAAFRKMTALLRILVAVVKQLVHVRRNFAAFGKTIQCLRQHGLRFTLLKIREASGRQENYAILNREPLFTDAELEAQRKKKFPRKVKFSIVVPLYNTPENFLREMIRSVLKQTYGDWELCMADGSDAAHADVGKICWEYAQKDSRIRYRKLEKNLGISGNTNACLDMATGDYISLFDHDDILHPAALYEVMRMICQRDADFIYTDENSFHDTPKDAFCPHFKPDYAPDTLRANNYICHLTTFKASLLEEAGRFDSRCDGSQDYDMVLRLTEKAKCIVHIPEILYYWRAHKGSVADSVGAKPYVLEAAHRAISSHLRRVGLEGEVLDSAAPSMYRLKYALKGTPMVSVLIPNCEHQADLDKCLSSIYSLTTYPNFEIVIVENNSKNKDIFAYYEEIQKKRENLRVIRWGGEFNYSAINNFGACETKGEYLLLLNNDTEVISPDWIQELLMYAQRSDVGAVGAKLYYPDGTVQHGGVALGVGGIAGHYFLGMSRESYGYMGRAIYAQNLSAVTAACMMVRRDVWEAVGGLNEDFKVAFNDVDLCMRIRKAGYLIVWTPFAELYHYESKSRGSDNNPDKRKRFLGEIDRFRKLWGMELDAGDPYYNPNFSQRRGNFSVVAPSLAKAGIEMRERIAQEQAAKAAAQHI